MLSALATVVSACLLVLWLAVLGNTYFFFVAALLHEYALVEVVASVVTGLQIFFLSSAIGDVLEKKRESNRVRNSAVVLVTVFLLAFYSFTKYFR